MLFRSDPQWWRMEKALSLKRKSATASASALARPGDSFLIVTEGTVTEPIYFELLRNELQLSTVRVRVEPGDGTDPQRVIETATRLANEQQRKCRSGTLGFNEPAKFEHLWAVLDADVAVKHGIWGEVGRLAGHRKVKLAHSRPCFEYWLLLHLAYTTRNDLHDGAAAKTVFMHEFRKAYSTLTTVANEAISAVISSWPKAVVHGEQVRQYHAAAGTRHPANPSTEVCALVRALNDSAPAYLRKLKPI